MCIDTVSLPDVSQYDDISIYCCISSMYVYVLVYVSVYAFFRLLRLAVRLLQSNVLSDEEERGLMREKIYANMLDYFW